MAKIRQEIIELEIKKDTAVALARFIEGEQITPNEIALVSWVASALRRELKVLIKKE